MSDYFLILFGFNKKNNQIEYCFKKSKLVQNDWF
jgi:hypothetical protein